MTLPTSIRPPQSSPVKAPSDKKSGSKKSEKKKTKHVRISADSVPPEQQEETTELMPETPTLVMKEVSANGDYFVLDKTFC